MRLLASLLFAVSLPVFAQSREVLDCAQYVQQIDIAIMNSDNLLHDQVEGVRMGNTMTFEQAAAIRQQVWQATLQDRFDIRHITHLGNVPDCARIAASATNKVAAILDSNGLHAQISRRE